MSVYAKGEPAAIKEAIKEFKVHQNLQDRIVARRDD